MKRKDTKESIRAYFFTNPTVRLRVRQIERAVGVTLPSAIRYARELEAEGMLKRQTVADVTVYSADRTSRRFLLEKRLSNIRRLFSSGLIDFLIEELSNPTMIVFGSYARGEDVEGSDIDLYIETPTKKRPDLRRFEKALNRKIQVFMHKTIHDVGNKELANNIMNGIVINGFMEVFP